jgi:hypothetical protein
MSTTEIGSAGDASGPSFAATAIIAAYNEEDVVDAVLDHLAAQRIGVYFIDNWSTDRTLERARARLGHGVIGVEAFPAESAEEQTASYPWAALLRRKEELATTLPGDWFFHHDADEFRESPWGGHDLLAALKIVDRAGYNAVDFALYDFRPTDDAFPPGADVREHLQYYEAPAAYDRRQINCWKKLAGVRVDLAGEGGHDARFPGRRVFPIRFLLQHYPIRSQSHGERKVHGERLPRFLAAERAIGWHRQYDEAGHTHVRSVDDLQRFDLETERLRVQIENRGTQELAEDLARARAASDATEDELAVARQVLAATVEERGRLEAALADARGARDAYAREVERRGEALTASQQQSAVVANERDAYAAEVEHRGAVLAASQEQVAILASERDAYVAEVEHRGAVLAASQKQVAILVSERDAHAAEVDRRGATLAALELRLGEARDQAGRARADALASEARLAAVLDSRSWRWSEPLRRLAALLRLAPRSR